MMQKQKTNADAITSLPKNLCLDTECSFNYATVCHSKNYRKCGSSLKTVQKHFNSKVPETSQRKAASEGPKAHLAHLKTRGQLGAIRSVHQCSVGMRDKHFNSSLSPVQKWRNNKTVKCQICFTIKFTMHNGGRHTDYKSRIIRRRDILHVHAYALEQCRQHDYSDRYLRNLMFIRLPMKAGLRNSEIRTLRAEYIDFQTCRFQVLDSKKYKLYPLPLDVETTDLLSQLLHDKHEGYVFRHVKSWKKRKQDMPLSKQLIWHTVKNIGLAAGVEGLKPRDLRDFFAAYWHYVKHGSIAVLQQLMRHENPEMTWQYVSSMVFEEDVEAEYRRHMDGFASKVGIDKMVPEVCRDCLKADVCQFAATMPSHATDCRFKLKQKEELKI